MPDQASARSRRRKVSSPGQGPRCGEVRGGSGLGGSERGRRDGGDVVEQGQIEQQAAVGPDRAEELHDEGPGHQSVGDGRRPARDEPVGERADAEDGDRGGQRIEPGGQQPGRADTGMLTGRPGPGRCSRRSVPGRRWPRPPPAAGLSARRAGRRDEPARYRRAPVISSCRVAATWPAAANARAAPMIR